MLVVIVIMLVMVVIVLVMLLAVVMMVVMMMLLGQVVQGQKRGRMLDGLEDLLAGQLVPGRGDHAGLGVVLADELNGLDHLVLRHQLGTAEDDGFGADDLVDKELAEVLQVHAALARVHDRHAAGQLDVVALLGLLHHAADVGQLAHAGGLDEDALGVIGIDQLVDRLLEIAGQRAADAARVELGHLNAAVLHEAAVDADLAVLVLKQYNLLALQGLREQFLDERGLARAQETGNYVYLDHKKHLLRQ